MDGLQFICYLAPQRPVMVSQCEYSEVGGGCIMGCVLSFHPLRYVRMGVWVKLPLGEPTLLISFMCV